MADWRGVRVFVTGGAGFFGAHLLSRLAHEGADVHGIVRPSSTRWRIDALSGVSWHAGDLEERDALRRLLDHLQPQFIFHAAAPGGHPPDAEAGTSAIQSAVRTTTNLCDVLSRPWLERLIHIGSSLEYGARAHPLRETDVLTPTTYRGIAKAASMLAALGLGRLHGNRIAALRPFSIFGPLESPSRFVPTVLRALADGSEIRLTGPGVRHDFVFVDDVVEAALLAATTPAAAGEIFNAGCGVQYSNEDVVAVAEAVTGRRARTIPGAFQSNPPDTSCWVADVTKAQALLGWTPRYTLTTGLRRTWELIGKGAELARAGS